MSRRFKVVSVNRVNNCCPSYATKALHLAQTRHARSRIQSNYFKRAIVKDRKRKWSRIYMLCDDLVLFRLRSKSSVQSALGLHFFLSNAIGVKTSSKKNLHTSNTTKDARTNDLASFCAQWTQKRGPKPLQKLSRGAAKLQSKKYWFLASAKRN